MSSRLLYLIAFIFLPIFTLSQPVVITFENAAGQGISVEALDTIYMSAAHADSTKAVFKTQEEQEKVGQSYMKMMKDFGKFLTQHQFEWKKRTRCFNRIYFNSRGTVDYFVYHFIEDSNQSLPVLTPEEEERFQFLVAEFLKTYKFPMNAPSEFAICSPVNYMPLKERDD